jgi:lipopolysaccharide biosynthesis protein
VEILAHYLPQFHPIPENDEWWGTGFTEWTNVAKARPLFRGHVQPRLPADLGFYDLRVREVREEQADLARRHGVTGFCYWHYWFAGRRLLERPFDEVLASGEPDFPFCVAWANQSWTGIWHGAPEKILLEQTYPGPEDDLEHFTYLRKAFEDPRYITVGGRPVMFVFRPGHMPEPARFVERWQKMAHDAGLGGLYLVAAPGDAGFHSHFNNGFDAAVYYRRPVTHDAVTSARDALIKLGVGRGPHRYPHSPEFGELPPDCRGRIFPGIYPNWDNTPRSGRNGIVITGSTPELFAGHVRRSIELAAANPPDEQVVMIKSWNEWAEGNYLEPDAEFGLGWLQAIEREVSRHRGTTSQP